jgi:hypothetical protein
MTINPPNPIQPNPFKSSPTHAPLRGLLEELASLLHVLGALLEQGPEEVGVGDGVIGPGALPLVHEEGVEAVVQRDGVGSVDGGDFGVCLHRGKKCVYACACVCVRACVNRLLHSAQSTHWRATSVLPLLIALRAEMCKSAQRTSRGSSSEGGSGR